MRRDVRGNLLFVQRASRAASRGERLAAARLRREDLLLP